MFCHQSAVLLNEGDLNPKLHSIVEFTVRKGGRVPKAKDVTAVGGGCIESVGRSKGTVAEWNEEKRSGTITADDGSGDIPFSKNDLWESSRTVIEVGDRIEFDYKKGSKGVYAVFCTKEGNVVCDCTICGKYGHRDQDCPTSAPENTYGAPTEVVPCFPDMSPGKIAGYISRSVCLGLIFVNMAEYQRNSGSARYLDMSRVISIQTNPE